MHEQSYAHPQDSVNAWEKPEKDISSYLWLTLRPCEGVVNAKAEM